MPFKPIHHLLSIVAQELDGEEETLLRAFKLFDNKRQNSLGSHGQNQGSGFSMERSGSREVSCMVFKIKNDLQWLILKTSSYCSLANMLVELASTRVICCLHLKR